MGKIIKWLDLFIAIFLMFLFPATWLHVKMRDRFFEACVQRVGEYGEMLQKQGYLSVEVAKVLFSKVDGMLGGLELALFEEGADGKKMLTLSAVAEGAWDYLGEDVYPLADGTGLLFILRMEADGFERAYYTFCGEAPARERACYFVVRDGLKERLKEEGADETISLFHTFYDPAGRDRVHAVRNRADAGAPEVGEGAHGQKRGHGGGHGSGSHGDIQ